MVQCIVILRLSNMTADTLHLAKGIILIINKFLLNLTRTSCVQYLRIITLENCSTLLEKEIFKGFALNCLCSNCFWLLFRR